LHGANKVAQAYKELSIFYCMNGSKHEILPYVPPPSRFPTASPPTPPSCPPGNYRTVLTFSSALAIFKEGKNAYIITSLIMVTLNKDRKRKQRKGKMDMDMEAELMKT